MSHEDQVAAFRYGLIAPIVCRQTPFMPGEQKAILEECSRQIHSIPHSNRQGISVRTLERYLALYRKGGYDALRPKEKSSKGTLRQMPPEVLEKAIALRKERPERSVEQILFLLEKHGVVEKGQIAYSTLARHLRKAHATRKVLTESKSGYRRFEAEDANIIWQADFQHTLYLPDPKNPQRKKKAILFAILDDHTRYIVHGQFYWDEKLPRMEDSLKKAILCHGIPSQLYVDNGSVFASHHLARICGKLSILLSHSRPYRPAGRGKIERFFQFVDSSFKPEAYLQIERGELTTLEGLNAAFHAWLHGYYHLRKHGSTKMTPTQRLQASTRPKRTVSAEILTDIFLWEEKRTVDKTGCIQAEGNSYEVSLDLVKKKVLLRFDPFDMSEIQVWYEGKRYEDAKPLDLTRPYHRKVKKVAKEPPAKTGLSFFQAAERERLAELEKDPFSVLRGKVSEQR